DGSDDHPVRVRSEEFERLVRILLHRVGNISTSDVLFPGIRQYHKYKADPSALRLYERVQDLFRAEFPKYQAQARLNGGPVDITPFVEEAGRRLGLRAGEMALEFAEELQLFVHQSPWSVFRQVEWVDVVELQGLFKSEKLDTLYGSFFDQRFLDYLHRNFDAI